MTPIHCRPDPLATLHDPGPRVPATSTDPRFYIERARTSVRNRRIHDWRLTLLPAAIEAGMPLFVLRVVKLLCDHQRGIHPVVWIGTEELAEELGADRRNVQRAIRRLVRAGLLRVLVGGGRQAIPKGRYGKANTYILGAALARDVEAVINSVTGDALQRQSTASLVTHYPAAPKIINSVTRDAPPLRGTSYPSGGSGERTAALTGGPSPIEPLSPTVAPHRFRDLLGAFNLGKRSSPNAL